MNTFLPGEGQWYALCTRPKCEKKVAAYLSKKRYDTYLPLRTVASQWSFLKRSESEPLFPTVVFVRLREDQLEAVKRVNGVIGLMHWLNQPAVIREEDVDMIKSFLARYQQVRIARTKVRREPVLEETQEEVGAKVVRMHTVTTSLASLGYVLIADIPVARPLPVAAETEEKLPRLYPYLRYTDAG